MIDKANGVKQSFDDWRYGPKSVKTTRIGAAPDASSTKPNAATAKPTAKPTVADPGGPKFAMPPLTLTPNRQGANNGPPPFTVAPSNTPAMPGGGASKKGIPFVTDSAGNKRYLTPDEQKLPQYEDTMKQFQDQQEEEVVETPADQ
jgi:hypothetical protein